MRRPSPAIPIAGPWLAATLAAVSTCAGVPAHALQAAATPTALSFTSAQEAQKVGLAYVRSKNFVQGREALEQSLKLKPDTNLHYRIHENLMEVYQTLDDPMPLASTVDFLIKNATGPAQILTTRHQLLNYVIRKKNAAVIASRFEKVLENQPTDRSALIVLSGLYADALKQPQKGAELTDTLMAEFRKLYNDRIPTGVLSDYAAQYAKCGRHRDAAAIWEQLVAADNHLRSWYAKELALSWLAAGDKEKARVAALSAASHPADDRSSILAYFWHRHLGDVFLATGEFSSAILQFEKALSKTEIGGYKEECRKKLEEARKGAGN